ncbi:hypothetical protein C8T65DRAFT_567022 [Cerioporus squamosus]|nr:hypothetical protein C8T65DRAFT_567022 [Cerioporus squamosus]
MANAGDAEIREHDKEFWMEKGNLVLLTRRVAFKVYRGLLAMQSPVFSDMFSAADAGTSSKLEGCPVVEMQDSPEDLRHLLRVVLPNRHRMLYTLHPEKAFTFHQLSSLVRLGHKYQIDDVQNQALVALQKYFAPCTFEELERANIVMSCNTRRGIELIHLSRLTNTQSMLPIAFYFCVAIGSRVVDGWRREDRTVQHLSPEDLKRCFEGYAQMGLKRDPMTNRIFDVGPSSDCKHPATCSAKLLERYLARRASVTRLITGNTDEIKRDFRPHICNACAKMLEERGVAERRALWDKLPTIFQL